MDSRTMITIEGRKGGKTRKFERAYRQDTPRPVVLPMSNAARLAGYEKQNAGRPLSGRQVRRLARHDPFELPDEVRWEIVGRREHLRKPIRQHFSDRTDNQRKPTGRVGMKRFGPVQGIEGLNKLLFSPRTGTKGMEIGEEHIWASVRGRMMARTGHGRRRRPGQRAAARGR